LSKQAKTELDGEIGRWGGILSEIDRDISMPESLRGDVLRARLDTAPKRNVFVLRPAIAYAAVFALALVAVFAFRSGFYGEQIMMNDTAAGWASPNPQTAMPAPAGGMPAPAAPPPTAAAMPMAEAEVLTAFDANDNFASERIPGNFPAASGVPPTLGGISPPK